MKAIINGREITGTVHLDHTLEHTATQSERETLAQALTLLAELIRTRELRPNEKILAYHAEWHA